MTDFRTQLYSTYVSTFKGRQTNTVESTGFLKWCDARYLPHLAGLDPDSPILEVGCGQGQFLEYLVTRGFLKVEGVDLSTEQVAVALERGLNVKVANVLDVLKQKDRYFDCVIAFDLIEHFNKEEALEFFSGVYEILNPNGILLLQTPNGQGLLPGLVVYGDLTHMTIFNMVSLTQILRFSGFSQISFEGTDPLAIRFRGRVRAILWAVIKRVANITRWAETGQTQAVWSQNLICISQKPS